MLSASEIAAVCHEACGALKYAQTGTRYRPWIAVDERTAANCVWSVRDRLRNGGEQPGAHERWVAHMKADGWKHGAMVSERFKTHPNIVPFAKLDQAAQAQGYLFSAVVDACRPYAAQIIPEGEMLEAIAS